MFVPIGDDNPLKVIKYQYVTVGLIVANIVVYLLSTLAPDADTVVASFAVVPLELLGLRPFGGIFPSDAVPLPERLTLLSYMFFHGDVVHLFGNMLFLWVFGDNVEDDLGHLRFLAFYLACGVAGGLLHAVMLPDSTAALIGASGAISGVVVAYLILHPRVNIWVLVLKFIPVRITAAWALGLWIAFQVVMAIFPPSDQTAWWAHVGGLLAGAGLILLMRRRPALSTGR